VTLFHGPVRVPYGAGAGRARITLSFPDWESEVMPVTEVVPVTLDVAVDEATWRGWFEEYGGWVLGGGALFGCVGLVWWRRALRRRRGRREPGRLAAHVPAGAWLPP
jgi:hypothetical protein